MELDKILIYGAGGHAKVVMDAIRTAESEIVFLLTDKDPQKKGRLVAGVQVIAVTEVHDVELFHVAIGGNFARQNETAALCAQGMRSYIVIHPRACVSVSSRIGDGSFVAANAVIGPDVQLGLGCIVNHGAVVDHECVVGEFSHVAPNATLGGQVQIGMRVLIGAGANILPGITIGDDCIIGAGAVVATNLASGGTYMGVPARKRRTT